MARILLIIAGIIAIVVREFLPCSDIPHGDNPDSVRRFLDFTVGVTRMIDIPGRILQGLAIKRVTVCQMKDETVVKTPGLSSPCTMECSEGVLPACGVGF